MDSKQRPSLSQRLAYFAAAGFFLLVSLTFGYTKLIGDGIFWDARVYARAIAAWRVGADAYAGSVSTLLFVSPPLFLATAGPLSSLFPGHTGWYVYVVAVVVAMGSIPYLLSRSYIRGEWMTPVVAMVLFSLQPRFIVERGMNTGNIAIPLYALALLAGIQGLRRNQWTYFYLVVFLASLVKPAFLAMLLISTLAGRRQYWQGAVTAFVVALVYGLQRLTVPSLYSEFQDAVHRQVIVKHDYGSGTYQLIDTASGRFPILQNLWIVSLLHAVLIGSIVFALFLLRRSREHPLVASLWVPALIVAAIVANPRMQGYDSCVAILPALYIYVEFFRHAIRSVRGTVAAALGLNLLLVLFTTSYDAGLNVILFGSIALTIVLAMQTRFQGTPIHAELRAESSG